jgi:hypothetical protein
MTLVELEAEVRAQRLVTEALVEKTAGVQEPLGMIFDRLFRGDVLDMQIDCLDRPEVGQAFQAACDRIRQRLPQ